TPEYVRRHGAPQHPADLAQHATLAYTLFSMGEVWPFTGPDGKAVQVKIRPRLRSNNGDVCRAAALQHQGIVL
ncbi:MAG: LysR family transcriptional regulator, partial [Brachymonas sp.]|nr:LysR family transcriptional regulator [Brachymonas sp.]